MIQVFIQGFLLQASLILALGAQNIFVLNAELRRSRHLLVASVSSICAHSSFLWASLGVVGVGFLFLYGVLKLKETKNGVEDVFVWIQTG